jgi:hypothetical protein
MEVVVSETSVNVYQTTRHHIPDESSLQPLFTQRTLRGGFSVMESNMQWVVFEVPSEFLNISYRNCCSLENNTRSYVPVTGHLETGFLVFLCLKQMLRWFARSKLILSQFRV